MKICPLQGMRSVKSIHECDKEACTWWNEELEQCCIVTIAIDIDDLIKGQKTLYTREV